MKVTDEEKAEIISLYESGCSVKHIMKQTNHHYGTVQYQIAKHKKGAQQPPRVKATTKKDVRLAGIGGKIKEYEAAIDELKGRIEKLKEVMVFLEEDEE